MEEADQLLAVAQLEGRVQALDALAGMYFKDEAERLIKSKPESEGIINTLLNIVDSRVQETAPLSVGKS